MSLSATLPVKPSVTTTSAAPCRICVPSTLPAKSMSEEPFARSASATCASRTSGVPRVSSSPLDSSPDARALDAVHDARERRAHERELDEVLGAHLRVGAHVEQRHRLAGHRERERERRARDAGSRRMWKSPAASAVPVEPAATSASASPAATARAARTIEESGSWRVAATASAAFAIDTGESTISTPGGRAELVGGPEEQDAHALRGRDRGAGSDLGWAEISAVGVDGDRDGHSRSS